MSRRRSEENIIDVRARLGHNVDQRNSDILGATTESARVGRSAGVFTTAMAITGLVWGLTLAIWATSLELTAPGRACRYKDGLAAF
ncbi:hypothetical protein JCM18916_1603 [Cutibacterium acnes JCM 18916]|nr:hypothetical protein JCM18916_1603 [Cutibacterium acnes JCM 18916]GAE78261.1 hypothetical protein JCM18918_4214 [Cutibacterium acnes JCM 18918]